MFVSTSKSSVFAAVALNFDEVWTNCLITKHGFIREMTIAWVEHMVWGE
jgi:hypothetical protein